MPPVRPTSQEIDRRILDITAGLLAQRGIKDTSVQAVADEAGYSKSGLLRRFPSKEALVHAALQQSTQLTNEAIARTDSVPYGHERDAVAVTALAELLFGYEGYAHLLMAAVTSVPGDAHYEHVYPMGRALYAMFVPDELLLADVERATRITGAIGALVGVALTYRRGVNAQQAHRFALDTAWNSLGHEGSFPSL